LPGGGGSKDRKSTSFEQRSLVTQHAVIVVNAQNRFAGWVIGHHLVSPHRDDRRCAPAKAGQICTLFATVVVQVDLWWECLNMRLDLSWLISLVNFDQSSSPLSLNTG
jgi:hypothetical protein